MTEPTSLGIAHFLSQSDAVGKTLLVILLLMSVISWVLIAAKGLAQLQRRGRSQKFLAQFWKAHTLEEVQAEISAQGVRDPFANLTAHAMHARGHHARYGTDELSKAGSEEEFLTRTIKSVLDEETTRMENGLTALATIGATAPFVGLFGTVWGVYHALVAIGMSGAGTLDKVAGPVGEALIMTGVGLAVAIPAVMAYNWLTRSNRVLLAKLDNFAFELMNFLQMGQRLRDAPPASSSASASRRPRAVGANGTNGTHGAAGTAAAQA